MNQLIMITGANAGLGKETARQLGHLATTKKIYLACRNQTKAEKARQDLEEITGRSIFEIVIMDVSKPQSVREAVLNLQEPIDALIMNAGGMGGKTPLAINENKVTNIYASNLHGHAILLNLLVEAEKLKNIALYAGSEAARGVRKMGLNRPSLKTSSTEEFTSIIDGSYFRDSKQEQDAYGLVKYIAALWMGAMAKKYPHLKFITMSPGGTSGTKVLDDMPTFQKIFLKHIVFPYVMPLIGMAHSIETGAKRFVKGISDDRLKSGAFYGSKETIITGDIIDQSTIFSDLANTEIQENAYVAVQRFF